MKLLTIFLDETDLSGEHSLYEEIVRRLLKRGVAGATVVKGIMGFGMHKTMHRERLFGINDDRPIMILVCDEEHKLRDALTDIRPLIKEGLVILQDVEVIPPLS